MPRGKPAHSEWSVEAKFCASRLVELIAYDDRTIVDNRDETAIERRVEVRCAKQSERFDILDGHSEASR